MRLQRLVLRAPGGHVETPRHRVDDAKADVVARALVLGTRIAETGDDPGTRSGYEFSGALSPTVGTSAAGTAGAASAASVSVFEGFDADQNRVRLDGELKTRGQLQFARGQVIADAEVRHVGFDVLRQARSPVR